MQLKFSIRDVLSTTSHVQDLVPFSISLALVGTEHSRRADELNRRDERQLAEAGLGAVEVRQDHRRQVREDTDGEVRQHLVATLS